MVRENKLTGNVQINRYNVPFLSRFLLFHKQLVAPQSFSILVSKPCFNLRANGWGIKFFLHKQCFPPTPFLFCPMESNLDLPCPTNPLPLQPSFPATYLILNLIMEHPRKRNQITEDSYMQKSIYHTMMHKH